MRGRQPKPPELLQRTNKASTRAKLPTQESRKKAKIPPLPKRARGTGVWHPRVLAWWAAAWRSPMAVEYLEADRQRLELVAELRQRFHLAAERGDSVTKLAAEIRQQEVS